MLENEANLQEYQNRRKKKKKMMVSGSESDGYLMEISSTSSLSLEQLHESLAASSEMQSGEEKRRKKKHKRKMEGGIAEESVSESITVGQGEGRKRKRRRRRQQQGNEEEDGAPVVSETEGALVEEMEKKKKKKKGSEVSDAEENALEVPDRETVIAEERVRDKETKKRRKDSKMEQDNNIMGAEERVREKKKKRRKDSEMEQDNNIMGAEERVREKKKKKKKHCEREENSDGESSSMMLSDDLEEQGMQYKLNSKTQKLTTADAVEKDLKSVDDDLEGEEKNMSTCAQYFMDAGMQRCIEELKEFIPNVEMKSPSVVHHLVKYDLPRFKTLRQEGESFKSGRFSAEENGKLLQNIKDFLALTGISSGAKLFFPSRYPEEAAEIKNMKNLHKFHSQIAVGIFRPWHEIYSRGRKVFDDFNYKGRYTEDELKNLNKLQNLYGNNWMKISELTGRSNTSLEKRFSQIAHQKGEWTTSEQKKLMRIIKEYMVTQVEPKGGTSEPTIRKEKLYSNVPWKSVSERMENRNWVQCRVKWMAILKQKMTSGADIYKGRKSLQAKIRLIRALYEMDVEDSSDVKWEDLTVTVGNVPPAYIQAKFYKLKVTQVPLWQSMSFGDIIDFLYNEVLPKLEKDLKNCEEDSVLPKDIFRLSEIFDTDEE
ncbi:transcription termination factor 1-like isoform X2 [Brienomyrus brachyistius]|uniref:transcription termination factor 1-like isoform X2 n=1 Tax=Brienomyrus brachyistius TaxID=42636 RepID=UPI0020B29CD9|nr:transcription termination factor 1-like isoform X2 [Brienomyrus brachyistius]